MLKMGAAKTADVENNSSFGLRTSGCVEKILGIVVLLLVIVLIVLIALLAGVRKQTGNVCMTKECTVVAAQVVSSIDFNVDPCEDFYEFSCGTWMKTHVVPQERSNLYTYGVLRDQVQVILKYLLEEDRPDDAVEAVGKAKDFYRSCMNETAIEMLDTSWVMEYSRRLGGWPVLGSWNESEFDLIETLALLREYGISPIISIYVSTDDKVFSERAIHVDEPALGMRSRDYLVEEKYSKTREAYYTFSKTIATLLGADPGTVDKDMRDLLNLDIKIANISMDKAARRNRESLYNKMSLSEVTKLTGEPENSTLTFDWVKYLQRVFEVSGKANITIDANETVILVSPSYYQQLFKILQGESKRTLANYCVWFFIKSSVQLLPKRFVEAATEYGKVVIGTASKKARWKTCVQNVVDHFGMALGRLFVKETFNEDAKKDALDMIHDILDAFYERLHDLDWMDTGTRQEALEKAQHISENIGYPDFILDDDELNAYYAEDTVDKTLYYKNLLDFARINSKNGLRVLREPYVKNRNRWHTKPTISNAFYSPLTNQITFPAGILQPPYYSESQPKSMNYGSIGWLIGHEVTHAFDDVGRKYDKEGNLRQWWSDAAIERFTNKTSCIINQYSSFYSEEADMNLESDHTQGEDIADNGGLRQAFRAYRIWVARKGREEPKLPGLDFTHNQLFFISFAQGWCGVMTQEYAVHQVVTDSHSPGRFRILGSLQNNEYFSEAFHCPVKSYMNPTKKCHVW